MQRIEDLPWQQPTVMVRYPHMLEMDAAVWTAHLQELAPAYDAVAYDVHVGTPVALPESATEIERKISDGVTRKRIDAVARSGSRIYVIEVKPLGNHQAVGQALLYTELFRREILGGENAEGMIVCAEHDPDIASLAAKNGILIHDTTVESF